MSKVLLIEDDASAAQATLRILHEMGHRADHVANVDDAMFELAAGTPDVIVLDLVLSESSVRLHDAIHRRGIPTLVVSGRDPDKLPEVAGQRHWAWLAKPYELEAFASSFRRVAERSPSVSSGAGSSISRSADGSMTAVKSPAQTVAEAMIDFTALAILGAVLVYVRPASIWINAGCILGILLLAGVRAADMLAISKGLPIRGGPSALMFALGSAFIHRIGGS